MSTTKIVVIGLFLVALLLFAAVEWIARRPDSPVPSLADLTAFVLRYEVGRLPIGRIAVYGFWWWVGWHFFAR